MEPQVLTVPPHTIDPHLHEINAQTYCETAAFIVHVFGKQANKQNASFSFISWSIIFKGLWQIKIPE